MNGSPKSPIDELEPGAQALVGAKVVSLPLPARSDLSDWVHLMEVVEALCPKWPERPVMRHGVFKL